MMETKRIGTDARHIRRFLDTCDGNWHECIYVDCPVCEAPGTCRQPGFLFHPDERAAPLILPLSDAEILFSRSPEPEECLLRMDLAVFLSMYGVYLKTLHIPARGCPCMELLRFQEDECYDW